MFWTDPGRKIFDERRPSCHPKKAIGLHLLGQWLNFKLLGITYLVGKIKFKPFFFRVHWLSEYSLDVEILGWSSYHPKPNLSNVPKRSPSSIIFRWLLFFEGVPYKDILLKHRTGDGRWQLKFRYVKDGPFVPLTWPVQIVTSKWATEHQAVDRYQKENAKIWMISKYRGTPKSSILIGCSIINHPFWGKNPLFLETPICIRQSESTQFCVAVLPSICLRKLSNKEAIF